MSSSGVGYLIVGTTILVESFGLFIGIKSTYFLVRIFRSACIWGNFDWHPVLSHCPPRFYSQQHFISSRIRFSDAKQRVSRPSLRFNLVSCSDCPGIIDLGLSHACLVPGLPICIQLIISHLQVLLDDFHQCRISLLYPKDSQQGITSRTHRLIISQELSFSFHIFTSIAHLSPHKLFKEILQTIRTEYPQLFKNL